MSKAASENTSQIKILTLAKASANGPVDWMESGDLFAKASQIVGDKAELSSVVIIDESAELLTENIAVARQFAEQGKNTVMPFNIGGSHYTAGMMLSSFDDDQNKRRLHFFYNDSLGNPIPDALRNALGEDVDIIDLCTSQQDNGYECGNHTLANLESFLAASEGDWSRDSLKEEMERKKKIILTPELDSEEFDEVPQFDQEYAFDENLKKVLGDKFEEKIKRKDDGSIESITCSSDAQAQAVSNGMKNFCDELGVPCEIEKVGSVYMVKVTMPLAFRGKDPFSMNQEELDALKKAIAAEEKDKVKVVQELGQEVSETEAELEEEQEESQDQEPKSKKPDRDAAQKAAAEVLKTLGGAANVFGEDDEDRNSAIPSFTKRLEGLAASKDQGRHSR
jgi:hypothetical protein